MKLKIYKKPNPLKVFDKVSKLKKLLKPIKVSNNDDFIDKLLLKPMEILHIINDGFSIEDHYHININCNVKCNIPIEFSAHIGEHGSNAWIIGEKPDGTSIDNSFGGQREDVVEVLENLRLEKLIVFTEIELSQVIGNSSSVFKYKLLE